MSVHLKFTYADWSTENFNGICLAPLYHRNLQNVQFVEHIYTHDIKVNPAVKNYYIDFLHQQGFDKPDKDVYRVSTEPPFNIVHWTSHVMLFRYLSEEGRLLDWWYKMLDVDPKLDPWVLFYVCHMNYGIVNNHNHTLLPSQIVDVPNAQGLLNSLRQQHTGFTPKILGIHQIWSNGIWQYQEDYVFNWKNEYERLFNSQILRTA